MSSQTHEEVRDETTMDYSETDSSTQTADDAEETPIRPVDEAEEEGVKKEEDRQKVSEVDSIGLFRYYWRRRCIIDALCLMISERGFRTGRFSSKVSKGL